MKHSQQKNLNSTFSFENPEVFEIKSEPWKRSFLQYRDARHIFPDNENIPTAHTKRKMRQNRIKSIYDIENSENTDIIFLHEGKKMHLTGGFQFRWLKILDFYTTFSIWNMRFSTN